MQRKAIAAMALYAAIVSSFPAQLAYSQATLPSNFYCVLSNSQTDLSTCVSYAIPLALIGVLVSLVVVAVAYMLGNVLSVSGLRNWYQNELKEAAKSLVIVTVIFSVVAILGSIAAIYFSGASSVSYSTGSITGSIGGLYTTVIGTDTTGYLGPQIKTTTDFFYTLFGFYDGIGLVKSFSISLYLPIVIYSIELDQGVKDWKPFSTTIVCYPGEAPPCGGITTQAGTVVTITLLSLYLQKDLLPWMIEAGLGILIPAGVVLRAIPFLRPLGGTLIGIGIGAALVYPALLLFFNMSITNYVVPQQVLSAQVPCEGAGYTAAFSGTGGVPQQLVDAWIGTAICNAYNYLKQSAPSITNVPAGFFAGIGDTLFSMDSIYPMLNYLFSLQFVDVLLQFILFIFDILIGVIITNDIISVLGGFRPQLGIGRIKLV